MLFSLFLFANLQQQVADGFVFCDDILVPLVIFDPF